MNRMQPKVSVITPFLNAEPFLADAIASVQRQTFKDWELLLIDDGSTDKSFSIASLAAATDPRIKLLRRPAEGAGGAAAARNIGLRAASGDFIAFLDADDLYENRMLETYLEALNTRPEAAMAYGPTRWWNVNNPDKDWTESMNRQAGRTHRPLWLLAWIILLQMGEVPCTCGVLIRRSAIDAVGGFEEHFRLYEDQTLWVKLFLRFPVHVLSYCGARYRQHHASTSARAIADGSYDPLGADLARARFLQWTQKYVNETGVRNWWLDQAMRLARAPCEERANPKVRFYRAARRGLHRAIKLRRSLEKDIQLCCSSFRLQSLSEGRG
jgi:glycosyltransferase involved in cell wall biosynthesis